MRASSVNTLIMETLANEGGHLDAQTVYERIRVHLPAVNPSTVYRALERLARAGKVSVSDLGTGKMVFEMVGAVAHHHLVCQNCGYRAEIDPKDAQDFFERVKQRSGFEILTNHLILFGVCPICRSTLESKG